ncbi:MAG: geranylgeranylglycerol-phosphate geranylgeranyltransferase [Candidatus Nezhaarchaeales archaeon]
MNSFTRDQGMHPLLHLIRPVNCLMASIAVFIGSFIAGGRAILLHPWLLIPGFIASFTLAGAAMAINDYYDREIDAINRPERPIPSGAIKPRTALTYASTLILIGILLSIVTPLSLIVALTALLIFTVYSAKGKRYGLIGNLMVSFCVALTFIYGGAVVNKVPFTLLVFALLALLANTGREVVKGVIDIPGDRKWGIQTLAVKHGVNVAVKVASAFYLAAVALTPLPLLLGFANTWYILLVIIADIGFLHLVFTLLLNPSPRQAKRAKGYSLVWMLVGLIAFASTQFP